MGQLPPDVEHLNAIRCRTGLLWTMETRKKNNRLWLKSSQLERRKAMVSAVRRGEALRQVARRFRVSVSTVHYWVDRADGQRLARVDWGDRSHRPHNI